MRWSIYLLRCGDGSLYTGVAIDVAARIDAHARGKGARYTRGRGPFSLEATTRVASKGEALVVEAAVKRLTREEKGALLRRGALGRFARRVLKPVRAAPKSAIVC